MSKDTPRGIEIDTIVVDEFADFPAEDHHVDALAYQGIDHQYTMQDVNALTENIRERLAKVKKQQRDRQILAFCYGMVTALCFVNWFIL